MIKTVVDSTLIPTGILPSKYPYLGVKENSVVMFIKPDTGVVLYDEDAVHEVGYYAIDWCEPLYHRLTGSIIMANE